METDRQEFRMAKFNGSPGEDFELWSLRLRAVLESKDLGTVVYEDKGAPPAHQGAALAAYEINLRRARAIIVTSLGDKPLRAIQSCEKPSEMFTKLNKRYAASTTASKIAVMTSLINKRYEEGKDMGEYLSEMESLFNKLSVMKSPLDSDMQVAILLVSISSIDFLAGTISAIKTMESERATWEYVSARLIEEMKSQDLVLASDMKSTVAAASSSKSRRKDYSKIKCYKCGKYGHIQRFCRSKGNSLPENRNVRAALARKRFEFPGFVVDSGCTQHITMNRKNFISLKKINPVKVSLADDFEVTAYEEGVVQINLDPVLGNGMTVLVLSKVLYIPNAGMNLISCAQLDAKGISTVIEKGVCKLIDRNNSRAQIGFATRRRTDNLYILQGNANVSRDRLLCARSKQSNSHPRDLILWHQRLGHISKDRVKKTANEKVLGVNLEQLPETIDCIPCVESKQTKSRSDGTLAKGYIHHTIHTDIIGPFQPPSIGGSRYIGCFVVEASRYGKVFFLKNRGEITNCFKEFQAWLERNTGDLVKRVHSDNAKEYKAMGKYLKAQGITQSFSTAYTPQSNGIVERYNRSLLDMIRAMLQTSGLPFKFWGEAALHASYILNVVSGKANDGMTPSEALIKSKPNISKLRVFGCAAYTHEPKERRFSKLAQRGRAGILLGHHAGMHRVWDIERKMVTETKHVKLDETVFPSKARNTQGLEHNEETEDSYFLGNLDTLNSAFLHSASVGEENIESEADLNSNVEKNGSNENEDTNEPRAKMPQDLDESTEPRYPRRARFAPDRYAANIARKYIHNDDMPTVSQAMKSRECSDWKTAIKSELDALQRNGTWKIVDRPQGVICFATW